MSDTPKSFDEWWNTDPKDEAGNEYGLDEFHLLREGWRECITHRVRPLERENADLRSKLEAAPRDAERWRYWRMFWPALCRMEVSRFARIDLTRKHVQSPADMDEVTDAAMQEGK